MDLGPRWIREFVAELASVPSGSAYTNFYAEGVSGNEVRRRNLELYLTAMARRETAVLLVGEAPGYRGTRLTGVPFADYGVLGDGVFFGASAGYKLPALDQRPPRERTSTVVWDVFLRHGFLPLLWAAFPFHPHAPGNPASNRAPTVEELQTGRAFLERILDVWPLQRVVAVGRVAERTLQLLDHSCAYIRHPARGGHRQFELGIRDLAREFPGVHRLPTAEIQQLALGGPRWPSVSDASGLRADL